MAWQTKAKKLAKAYLTWKTFKFGGILGAAYGLFKLYQNRQQFA